MEPFVLLQAKTSGSHNRSGSNDHFRWVQRNAFGFRKLLRRRIRLDQLVRASRRGQRHPESGQIDPDLRRRHIVYYAFALQGMQQINSSIRNKKSGLSQWISG